MKFKNLTIKPLLAMICCAFVAVGCSNVETTATEGVAQKPADDSATVEVSVVSKENNKKVMQDLQKNLLLSGIDAKILSATPTQMEGLYWVTAEGMPAFFTDTKGKHVIQGSLIEVGGEKPIDIGAQFNAKVAKDKLASVAKEDMVIYPAKGETKSVIYVFTDTTCPYCQKIHQDVKELNSNGVEVRYLAWPRGPRAVPSLEAIWCSEDKQKAMDTVKSGGTIEPKTCENPIDAQTELGFSMGVSGTPAVFTEEGEQIGGYLPPKAIFKALGL